MTTQLGDILCNCFALRLSPAMPLHLHAQGVCHHLCLAADGGLDLQLHIILDGLPQSEAHAISEAPGVLEADLPSYVKGLASEQHSEKDDDVS